MAEAKAELDLDVRGLDRGAREAFAAYGRVIMADRNMRAQIEKPSKGGGAFQFLEGENKVKRNLAGLTQEILSARSASDVLASSAVRLSETLKVGLGAGLGVGIGMALKSQFEDAAKEFDIFNQKRAEAMNFSFAGADESEITEQIAKVGEVAKLSEQKVNSLWGAAVKLGVAWGWIGERSDTAEELNLYKATNDDANSEKAAAETRVRNLKKSESKVRVAESDIGVTQAELAVDRSPEEIKRGALTSKKTILDDKASIATSKYEEARAGGAPQTRVDKLGEAATIANNEARKAAAELNKFEKDTSREKELQLAMADATIESMRAQISGNKELASSIERAAKAEEAINKALDSGNTALASRLRTQAALAQQQANIQSASGADGRPQSRGELARAARVNRQNSARANRAETRDFENYRMTRVNRDSSGNITGGIDRDTGKYREITEDDRKKHDEERVAREGGAAQEERKRDDTIKSAKFEGATSDNKKGGSAQANAGSDLASKVDAILSEMQSWR